LNLRAKTLLQAAEHFNRQRRTAKQRRIEWKLDFWEWLRIWEDSGHLSERGRRKEEWQMCRFEDIGPYASSNVRIDKMEANIQEAHRSRAREKVTGAIKTFPGCLTANST
jgi:hypothetical protein